jgi:hypothetical protein
MKHFYAIILAIFSVAFANATVITAINDNGNWKDKKSWDLNRAPKKGDTIVIPAGITISLDKTVSLNDVFIKVQGTLEMTKKGKLKLNKNSAIEIAKDAALVGDDKDQQILIDNVTKYTGSEGNIAGPVRADINTGKNPYGFAALSMLPVKFTSFAATKTSSKVILNWSTAQEINNNRFEIEKSLDGNNWQTIAMVLGAGTTQAVSNYSYTDTHVSNATLYYRIRQVDLNGQSTVSATQIIRGENSLNSVEARVYASSAHSLQINFNAALAQTVMVRVFDLNGRLVGQQSFASASSNISMSFARDLKGVHIVQVADGSNLRQVNKILF